VAVTEVIEHRFVGGNFTRETYSVEVEYQATTDQKNDGPDVVRRHSTFRLGKSYSFAGDRNAALILKTVSVALLSEGVRTKWLVSCSFESPDPSEAGEPGQGGGGGGDPGNKDQPPNDGSPTLMDPPRLSIGFVTKSEPMMRAKYQWVEEYDFNGFRRFLYVNQLGGPGGGPYVGPVCNSVSIPKVPQPEREVAYPIFKLEGWITIDELNAKKKQLMEAKGKLNALPYRVQSPPTAKKKRFSMDCPAYSLRVENVQIGDMTDFMPLDWVRISYEFAYNERLWFHREFDESIAIRPDPDTYNDRVAAGLNPELEIMRDERGTALPSPVPLDGKGEINRTLVSKGGKAEASTNPLSYFLAFLPDEKDLIILQTLPTLWK